ncbi:DUF4259 domain-containing protein [Deinococcus sp. Arct2-2]|uniref:DUF4259 domain-containing protein n=1 Tax=Deinococcus sp. Arct2-2 TaxID=2568653 RepID=UPI0010A4662A|nr:DUF4259 domain-containing protein [Deinococcus sp. Arct2-2]THF70618.1 DUF4259 domain-containing protein [Deinococcus sp. Arct2-2]
MNVWGTGPFENDAGAAFVQEVVQDGEFALAEAFEVALDPDTVFLAAEEGHRAYAAAAVLAAVLGGETAGMTDAGLRSWVQNADQSDLAPLQDIARDALERIVGPDSELPDLWEDTADAEAWQAEIERLQGVLE